jgi:fatty acid desaturase
MRTFAELQNEMRRRGFYRKATARILAQLGLMLLLIGVCAAIFFTVETWWVRVLAVIFAAAGSVGISTNSHTSSHYATSDRKWVNEALTFFGYPFINFVSAHYWWYKHVTGHHPAPNVIGVDTDIDLMPWFSFTKEQYEGSPRWRRVWYCLQGLVILLVLPFLAVKMQIDGWVYLLRNLCDGKRRLASHWLDLALLLLHVAAWYALPMLFLPAAGVLIFNFGRVLAGGVIMFSVFAPAHFPEEAAAVFPSTKPEDFVLLQTATTVNFRTGLIGRLLCAGVQYQIEHHLFCNISHVYYPQASKLVEQFCRENGYPYRSMSWDLALWKTYLSFWKPRITHGDLEELRLPGPAGTAPGTVPMTRSADVAKARRRGSASLRGPNPRASKTRLSA